MCHGCDDAGACCEHRKDTGSGRKCDRCAHNPLKRIASNIFGNFRYEIITSLSDFRSACACQKQSVEDKVKYCDDAAGEDHGVRDAVVFGGQLTGMLGGQFAGDIDTGVEASVGKGDEEELDQESLKE